MEIKNYDCWENALCKTKQAIQIWLFEIISKWFSQNHANHLEIVSKSQIWITCFVSWAPGQKVEAAKPLWGRGGWSCVHYRRWSALPLKVLQKQLKEAKTSAPRSCKGKWDRCARRPPLTKCISRLLFSLFVRKIVLNLGMSVSHRWQIPRFPTSPYRAHDDRGWLEQSRVMMRHIVVCQMRVFTSIMLWSVKVNCKPKCTAVQHLNRTHFKVTMVAPLLWAVANGFKEMVMFY